MDHAKTAANRHHACSRLRAVDENSSLPVITGPSWFGGIAMHAWSSRSLGARIEHDFHQVWLTRVQPGKPLWPIAKRSDRGNQGLHLDFPVGQQLHCLRIFAR